MIRYLDSSAQGISLTRMVGGVIGFAVGLSWWLVPEASIPPLSLGALDLLLFILAVAVLELLPIQLPDGRVVGTAVAVVGAAAILGAAPPVVALISVVGVTIAYLRHRAIPRLDQLLGRALLGWMLAGIAGLGMAVGPPTWSGDALTGAPAMIDLGGSVAVAAALLIGGPLTSALGRSRGAWRFVLRRTGEAILADGPRNVAVVSTAVLGALVHPVLGAWTLPTMLIPLAAVRFGLDREGQIAGAYDQTVRAMSRLPEQLGDGEAGHGVRVAVLAAEVAFELGLDSTAVRQVRQASHLHELGRIQLERPETVDDDQRVVPRREVASAGAAVVRRAAGLEPVAAIVEGHGDLVNATPDAALAARIVAACCDIDRYAPDPAERGQRHEVVVRLVREIGDLDVVAALDRVLDRQLA
jgi:hypothetical protein